MHSKKLSKDFTQGNIARQLLLFALPFMASNALQVLYSTIDMVIVGKFVGTAGLSAVSQSSQIVNFATMVCLGFSNAGQVLLAQALGAGKRREMNDIIGTLFTFISTLSLALSGVILCTSRWILDVMNIPAESYAMAKDYLIICAAGLIFTAGYNMVSAVLRGMGDAKRPFLFIGIASAVNLILDILFTGILGWGVAGAAWATIIGQAASFLFSLYYLYKKKAEFGFDFQKASFLPRRKYVKMIVGLGTPMAIQAGFINLSMLVVNSMINNVGVVASATFGVGVRIDDIVNKISQGIQYAAVPMMKNLVKDARKVQQTILLVGDITDIYVNSFERMLNDPYFTVEELSAIALGYTKLLEESAHLLNDLKAVVNENGLSMSDKDRMDIVDTCYSRMLEYRSLVQYYTNKNIGVSYLRAKKQNDVDRVMSLYGSPSERYW